MIAWLNSLQWRHHHTDSRLFAQPFVQAQIKENIKDSRHWPLWGAFVTGGVPLQRVRNAGKVSIWKRHYVMRNELTPPVLNPVYAAQTKSIPWLLMPWPLRRQVISSNGTDYAMSSTRTDLNSPLMVPHICVSELGQHWFRWWLVACIVPSHYLNQGCIMTNWTLTNKRKWNFNKNTTVFIYDNAFENVIYEMVVILFRGRRVNHLHHLSFEKLKYIFMSPKIYSARPGLNMNRNHICPDNNSLFKTAFRLSHETILFLYSNVVLISGPFYQHAYPTMDK